MKQKITIPPVLHIFIFVHVFLNCSKLSLEEIKTEEAEPERRIVVDSVWKIEKGFDNSLNYKGRQLSSQGVAIKNKVLFRLYDTGICQTYDISTLNRPIKISLFELGSFSSINHCNAAQFSITDDSDTLLYIAGLRGKCFVEQINETSSDLIQTITLPELDIFNNSQVMNLICGDDGNIWAFGHSLANKTLYFAKIKKPNMVDKEVLLSKSDVLDYWLVPNYEYNQSVWQGGMIYNGLLYFVFGTTSSKRKIEIYDTTTHEKILTINLNDYISEEPEDCDLIDNHIILAVNGGKGLYVIRTQTN